MTKKLSPQERADGDLLAANISLGAAKDDYKAHHTTRTAAILYGARAARHAREAERDALATDRKE